MVSSHIRLRAPIEEAMTRFGRWIGTAEIAVPRLVSDRNAVDAALGADGEWLGYTVWVYPADSWTVFEEVSGGLARPAADWLSLAEGGDLVYAAANDAIGYAEIVVVEKGRLVRHYLQDEQDRDADVDVGRLPEEAGKPFEDWIRATSWVETDADRLPRPDAGLLWIFRDPLDSDDRDRAHHE